MCNKLNLSDKFDSYFKNVIAYDVQILINKLECHYRTI